MGVASCFYCGDYFRNFIYNNINFNDEVLINDDKDKTLSTIPELTKAIELMVLLPEKLIINGKEYIKTESIYDDEGYDINRLDKNGFTKNGYYKKLWYG